MYQSVTKSCALRKPEFHNLSSKIQIGSPGPCTLSPRPGWSKTGRTKGHITVWEKNCGPQWENSNAIKRLVYCSNSPNFSCRPKAIFDSRVIFKFSVCLSATQNGDFLLEKRYATHERNRKTTFIGFGYKVNVRFSFHSGQTQAGQWRI